LKRSIRRHCPHVLRHNAPVETQNIVTSRCCRCERHRRVGTLGEKYERSCREMVLRKACANGLDDVLEGWKCELGKIVWGKLSCP
jgi:hypothetical protein